MLAKILKSKETALMRTKLSSKGQVLLPRAAREKLNLVSGIQLECSVQGEAIVLKPKRGKIASPKLVQDKITGLIVTKGAGDQPPVSSKSVRQFLANFP